MTHEIHQALLVFNKPLSLQVFLLLKCSLQERPLCVLYGITQADVGHSNIQNQFWARHLSDASLTSLSQTQIYFVIIGKFSNFCKLKVIECWVSAYCGVLRIVRGDQIASVEWRDCSDESILMQIIYWCKTCCIQEAMQHALIWEWVQSFFLSHSSLSSGYVCLQGRPAEAFRTTGLDIDAFEDMIKGSWFGLWCQIKHQNCPVCNQEVLWMSWLD